ncbi:stimulated by retinoic acid gene 6 protein-like isoform X2 [Dysidea avara]|uniref:stimulated by retinoic acid gene 6 protein-like isoform X2 n=1 Tax=Dysidea avara TaxID=196820 RepID=UPI0033279015
MCAEDTLESQWFILFITMMIIPTAVFALVASVHGKILVLSHAIGLIYTIIIFTEQMLAITDCTAVVSSVTPKYYRDALLARIYGTVLPISICTVVAGAYFTIKGIQAVVYIILDKSFSKQDVSHHLRYVKCLLARPTSEAEETGSSTIITKITSPLKRYVYQIDPNYKYSVRMISVTSVIIVGLIVLTVTSISQLFESVSFVDDSLPEQTEVTRGIINTALAFSVIIPVVSFTTVVISFLFLVVAYRDHCRSVWKGDYSFMPNKRIPPSRALVRSTFYFGWQIGMVLWAWFFYNVLLAVLVTAIVSVVLLIVYVPEIREWLIRRAILLASTTITGVVFTIAQVLVGKFVFDNGTSTVANNSRVFHMYSYFLLFYNALVGLAKAVRRIVTSAVLNLFFLPRLDRPLVIKGFEYLDKGYVAYLSVVRVDAAYNNPVMNTFVYLLSQTVRGNSVNPTGLLNRFTYQKRYTVSSDHTPVTIGKARKMWHLAYTLLRNPELIELRKNEVIVSKSVFFTKELNSSDLLLSSDGAVSAVNKLANVDCENPNEETIEIDVIKKPLDDESTVNVSPLNNGFSVANTRAISEYEESKTKEDDHSETNADS